MQIHRALWPACLANQEAPSSVRDPDSKEKVVSKDGRHMASGLHTHVLTPSTHKCTHTQTRVVQTL